MEEQLYQEIQSYLEGQLAPDAVNAFDARLQTDADFFQEFTLYKGLWLARRKQQREDQPLMDLLHSQSRELLQSESFSTPVSDPDFSINDLLVGKTTKRIPIWRSSIGRWAIAAGLILLISMIWFMNQPNPDNPTALAKEFYDKPQKEGLLGAAKSNLDASYAHFEAGAYQDALIKLNQMSDDTIHANQIQFLRGACHFELKAYAEAISAFKQVGSSSILYGTAQKNIALAFLAQNNLPEAKNQLNLMLEDNFVGKNTQSVAQILLKRLEKNSK